MFESSHSGIWTFFFNKLRLMPADAIAPDIVKSSRYLFCCFVSDRIPVFVLSKQSYDDECNS